MRFLARFLGLLFAAGAFVAFVIDGARSIADGSLHAQSIGGAWAYLSETGLASVQESVQATFSPLLWNTVAIPMLALPLFLALLLLATLLLWLGRRPRSRIGYVVRG